jgi:Flp pilus assembly protein TadG
MKGTPMSALAPASRPASAGGDRQAQRGIVIVEFALILLVILTLVTATVLVGSMLAQYTALLKANNAAARYLSTLPPVQMRTPGGWYEAQDTVRTMVNAAAAAASINGDPSIDFDCTPKCGNGIFSDLPVTITVYLQTDFIIGNEGAFAYDIFSQYTQVRTEVTVLYAN